MLSFELEFVADESRCCCVWNSTRNPDMNRWPKRPVNIQPYNRSSRSFVWRCCTRQRQDEASALHHLLYVCRIVEQHRELNAAVPDLRKIRRTSISRIEARGSVVRRKQNQGVQKLL